MRRVDVTSASKLAELLDLAGEENVLLKTPDGREFVLAEVDDFEAEVEAVCQNQDLMKFLEERSREEKTYSLAEVEKKLGLV
ncbi:MAG TPA: hypothetical protein VHC97_17495 [Thermoanaerobaculia bacterium]|jgi:hypothetical protein|nr:hypothetical protein [Thermoanaerobaculia bacterium]